MSQNRVLCKYFMHGACLRGDACPFSHNWNDQESNVCTFYQRGVCSYGSRCRYEHVKLQRPANPYIPLSAPPSAPPPEIPREIAKQGASVSIQGKAGLPLCSAWQTAEDLPILIDPDIWEGPSSKTDVNDESIWATLSRTAADPADEPICPFAAAGNCPHGDACVYLHGDLCTICGKHCLHPFRPAEVEMHKQQCQHNKKRLDALRMSQDIECSVCLELVLSKPNVSERKFGLLSGCDHPFCISCIRGWRSGSHAPGMDLDTVVRACPVCRVGSHYVIPSIVWYSTPEEKEEIVQGYKRKLSAIDCRHFDFGNGNCPFGTSCFYKHAYKDGTTQEVKLRHLGAADGSTVIAKNVRLSDFLGSLGGR